MTRKRATSPGPTSTIAGTGAASWATAIAGASTSHRYRQASSRASSRPSAWARRKVSTTLTTSSASTTASTCPKGWYLNLSFSYRSSGTYDFVTISSVHNFDFQLYKSFLKDRLSLSLNVSDIFNTKRQKTDGTYGNVRFQQQKWEDTRSVQLRLTYRFNQAKKQYRGENSAQEAVGRMGGK